MGRRRASHLYRGRGTPERERRAFTEEYGPRKGPKVYGAVVGKVARERAERRPSGELRERVRGHLETRNGRTFRVRAHTARIHAEPHGRGHHMGRCGTACRRGKHAHRHPGRRRRR
ncbi:MAG: hypothetical protein L3J91_00105 [Thermoplasmata archaeon]|nr:hypothetical protein [Thermoplasmata archaeon]